MKKTIPILISLFLLSLTLSLNATIVIITQQDNTFSPKTFDVTVGDTIRWVWTSGDHTTTSSVVPSGAATWDSPLTSAVPQFDYIVTVAGNYDYVCTPHIALGMIGSFTATGSLGISETINTPIKIYPNPAKDQASIMLTSNKSENALLTVYDLLGNQVNRNEVTMKSGLNNIAIPVTELQPGIYFIELKLSDQSTIVRRFVKSR